jgi:hypothetical protein
MTMATDLVRRLRAGCLGLFETTEAATVRKRRELGYETPEALLVKPKGQSTAANVGVVLGSMYTIGCYVVWFLTFVGCWVYCISEYGFLLGVGLGWLPSAIAASVAAAVWL